MGAPKGWHHTEDAKRRIGEASRKRWERWNRARRLLDAIEAAEQDTEIGALVTKDGRLVQ